MANKPNRPICQIPPSYIKDFQQSTKSLKLSLKKEISNYSVFSQALKNALRKLSPNTTKLCPAYSTSSFEHLRKNIIIIIFMLLHTERNE
jgi:hypothetical protein